MFKNLKPLPTNEISSQCLNHTFNSAKEIITGAKWPFKMIDATSKIQSGFLEGNVFELGNFDECLEIEVEEEWGSFVGQHCVTIYKYESPSLTDLVKNLGTVPIFWSACIPSSCSPQDLQYLLSRMSNNFIVDPLLCHTKNSSRPLETIDWIAISVFFILGLTCFLSTTYDCIMKDSDRRNKMLLLFSWRTNGSSLFSTKAAKDDFHVLHGIRFLSMFCIILGHTIVVSISSPSINLLRFMDKGREWKHLYTGNFTFAVDTFFVMSGMLLCYFTLKFLDTGRKFNIFVFYVHRFLRVSPLLGSAMLLHVSFIDKLGNGPLWDFIYRNTEKKFCVDYWWSTLLGIQNYLNPSETCIAPSWFLAVDTQLFMLSPIFLLSLRKWPKFGLGLTIGTTIAGMISTFIESYIHKDNPDYIKVRTNVELGYNYYNTHTRGVSWFFGILCGYLMYRTMDWRARVAAGTERLSKVIVTSGWILTIVLLTAVYVSLHPFLQKDYEYNVVEAALYYTFARPIWCICMIWIIFICISGYGGIANTILCWPIWRPLSRLTYAMYVFHNDIIIARLASVRVPEYQSVNEKAGKFLETIMLTIIVATIMTLAIESPILRIERMVYGKEIKQLKSQTYKPIVETVTIDMLNGSGNTEKKQE
ncbi:nose resistant to fluoxetine protein 6-like [Periplaneta americana]|uniref:nose resistant to fluoxetine protein 6-like n=1 Tax=Periplaneta americana TaxID=6978 RepID=UPI0037E90C51